VVRCVEFLSTFLSCSVDRINKLPDLVTPMSRARTWVTCHFYTNVDSVSGSSQAGVCAIRTWNRDMSSDLKLSRGVRVRSDRVPCWVLVLGIWTVTAGYDSLPLHGT
jgi:hypothetical protein